MDSSHQWQQALTLKLLWGGVITTTFIKGPLCAEHLLEEGTPLEEGLGSMEPILQMKMLWLTNVENLPKVTVSM